jgi:hypothetical protein
LLPFFPLYSAADFSAGYLVFGFHPGRLPPFRSDEHGFSGSGACPELDPGSRAGSAFAGMTE